MPSSATDPIVMLRLFEMIQTALDTEKRELIAAFEQARNLACSELGTGLLPSIFGGYKGIVAAKILPERTSLLRKNFEILLKDIGQRRRASIVLFKPYFEEAKRSIPKKQKLSRKPE